MNDIGITPVHQTNSWSCWACVVAMILGEPLEHIIEHVGHDGSEEYPESTHPNKRRGFSSCEMVKCLLDHGVSVGTGAKIDASGSEIPEKIVIEIDRSIPAILVVTSERFGAPHEHVVFWDGELVYDPNPRHQRPRTLEEMPEVLEWHPLFREE